MKDINEVLRQKEEDLARLRHEIESLQVVASLLSDELTSDEPTEKKESAAEKTVDDGTGSEATGTDGLFTSIADSRSSLWNVLKRGK
jgi:hypothetical protein